MDSAGCTQNLVMLPRDAPTDVLNELQLVQDFYGADSPADHQRVMALFAPHARLDLPQMYVQGRNNISAVMFYAKSFIADVDIEPYMVEVGVGGANGVLLPGMHPHTATTSTAPTSSTTSTDSTSSTCTSAATSKRRRAGKPPKGPPGSSGAAAGALANGNGAASGGQRTQPSRLGRKQAPSPQQQQHHAAAAGGGAPSSVLFPDVQRPRSRHQHSDQTGGGGCVSDAVDGGTAQNAGGGDRHAPGPMSQTHVYAVATITPKSLLRLLSLNLLPREIHLRTRITLVWDDEAGEVLILQERPDNLPVGWVPGALKRAVGKALGYVSTRSQWLIGRLCATRLVAHRWPRLSALHGTGL